MGRKERNESVICDKADLPAGYVPLGTLATDSGSTPLYGYVQRAYERGEWTRSLFRCRGKRFIHRDDLERLTAEFNSRQAAESVEPREEEGGTQEYQSACHSLTSIDKTLNEICRVMERLTTAVESIATQPKESDAEGSWRGVNGECV